MNHKSEATTKSIAEPVKCPAPPRNFGLSLITLLMTACSTPGQSAGFTTAIQPYAVSLSPDYVIKPIISAGDRVPLSSNPSKQFQMIGVPDGLGAHKIGGGGAVVFMNHEEI